MKEHELKSTQDRLRSKIEAALNRDGVVILPPSDAVDLLRNLSGIGTTSVCTILDPWYNKGFGGVVDRDEYDKFISELLDVSSHLSAHVYLWGFPEIVARYVEDVPESLKLEAWLTWYYKNNPSVIRGWRSAQNACLHFRRADGVMHPEHFLNAKQLEKMREGKLRYMPGPTSVIDDQFSDEDVIEKIDDVIQESLMVGFVRKHEQTGHPSQKPISVYDRIIRMATVEGDVVVDPMAGSGTTGAACLALGRKAILCDSDPQYIAMMEKRLGLNCLSVTF